MYGSRAAAGGWHSDRASTLAVGMSFYIGVLLLVCFTTRTGSVVVQFMDVI